MTDEEKIKALKYVAALEDPTAELRRLRGDEWQEPYGPNEILYLFKRDGVIVGHIHYSDACEWECYVCRGETNTIKDSSSVRGKAKARAWVERNAC